MLLHRPRPGKDNFFPSGMKHKIFRRILIRRARLKKTFLQTKQKNRTFDLECPNNETRDHWYHQVLKLTNRKDSIKDITWQIKLSISNNLKVKALKKEERMRTMLKGPEKFLEDAFNRADKRLELHYLTDLGLLFFWRVWDFCSWALNILIC